MTLTKRFSRLLVPVVLVAFLLSGPATGAVSITPFPPDGAAVLIVADGWAYIVRGTVPVATWKLVDGPDPPIPPTPQQVSGVWIIEEQTDRTAAQGKVMDDPVWQAAALAKGLTYRIEDDDQPGELAPWLSACLNAIQAGKVALPAVCFLDEYGAVVKVQTLPTTVEAMRALIGGLK